ncbi:MAG: asparaginase domain-containing protein [Patescibacteria group bacterium]
MKIKIFVTGGTFDKEYDEITEKLVFKETHLPQMLVRGRCRIEVEVKNLMLIDSLNMTAEDQQLIVKQCKECPEDKIIVTHGTSHMEDTARLLNENVKDKTIVLTGAMSPYAFGSSDGLFNLGCAMAFVQTLPFGAYVTMNGKCFVGGKVTKNTKTGDFEEIN